MNNVIALLDDFGNGAIFPTDKIDNIFFDDIRNESAKDGAWKVTVTTRYSSFELKFRTHSAAIIAWSAILRTFDTPNEEPKTDQTKQRKSRRIFHGIKKT